MPIEPIGDMRYKSLTGEYVGGDVKFPDGAIAIEGAKLHHRGSALLSETNMDLAGADGEYLHVTDSADIENFGSLPAGSRRYLTFDDECTLIHSSDLILPGNANLYLPAGSSIEIVSEGGSSFRLLAFRLAHGVAPWTRSLRDSATEQDVVTADENLIHFNNFDDVDFGGNTREVFQFSGGLVGCRKFSISLNTIKALGAVTSGNIDIAAYNGMMLFDFAIKHATALAGPSLSAATARLQFTKSGGQDYAGAAFNVFQATSNTAFMANDLSGGDINKLPWMLGGASWAQTSTWRLGMALTGCNANALTAGSIEVWVTYMYRP